MSRFFSKYLLTFRAGQVSLLIMLLYTSTFLLYQLSHGVRIQATVVKYEDHKTFLPTATKKPPSLDLDDIFISVKTSKQLHEKRLAIIIKTWFQLAKNQTWFFTDANDANFQKQTGGHMINTKCGWTHSSRALSCKMSVEFDRYLQSKKKWFCHFDDDNYVNVPRLLDFLEKYDPQKNWYFGKTSVTKPVTFYQTIKGRKNKKKVSFWFATGGAGFCISRALALLMAPVAGGGKFKRTAKIIGFPDDVTMGYIIEHLMRQKLTKVELLHSHLEQLKLIRNDSFHEQISLSYHCLQTTVKGKTNSTWNRISINGFSEEEDPTRFLSLHCRLFPKSDVC